LNVRLNLATKPLESQRKFYVSAGLVAALGAVLFLVLGLHVYAELKAQQNLRSQEQENDKRAAVLQNRRRELDDFFARPENARLKERTAFVNGILEEESFDWTRMFMDLEKMLPVGVHVVSIQQKLEKGRISVRLTVGATSDEAKIKFLKAMEGAPAFKNVQLLSEQAPGPGSGSGDQSVLELSAIYART
jgi:Tfp pilus assembly protein PilN